MGNVIGLPRAPRSAPGTQTVRTYGTASGLEVLLVTDADAVTVSPLLPRTHASAAAWQDFTSHFAAAFGEAGTEPDAPGARSKRSGLAIWDQGEATGRIEPWSRVALHCLQLNRQIPKAHGGKFLTADDRERLTVIERDGWWPTNADAAWIEGIVARCHEARERWRAAEKAPA